MDDRKALCGILFVLHTGIPWEFLPQELGFGSGMTCWRRLEEWNRARVWQRLHELLLAELPGARPADLVERGDRQLAGPGAQGRPKTGPSPVDRRARTGSIRRSRGCSASRLRVMPLWWVVPLPRIAATIRASGWAANSWLRK
ncbi:hypothetical protein DKT69_16685 [Micromonospora sicca]|uniref:Insertion element IS402-like domain-containing protein n=1 Tax=Micromonospora sicca TaxID=2202420 RepID=A0A317DNA8_9ACTN|nr:transposase [Micromonospora sp. ATA51]PWR14415.1 hypothetical protein DKT69_16685 [Micromonospora sp. 4G51]